MEASKIVLVGAGNVATHLGRALRQAGHDIIQVYSRTEESARTLAGQLETGFTVQMDEVRTDAELYVVAVKDDALAEVLPRLVRRSPTALYVHTAGSISIDVWKGLTSRYGVLYPLQTFSRRRPVDFAEIPCFVEARTAADTEYLLRLAGGMSQCVYEATSAQRLYLHVAAVFACNFTNHLYAVCQQLLEEHGLPFEVMLPLIDETARKVHQLPPVEAQTGPARRGDTTVMEHHLQLLHERPELAAVYDILSKSIYSMTHYD